MARRTKDELLNIVRNYSNYEGTVENYCKDNHLATSTYYTYKRLLNKDHKGLTYEVVKVIEKDDITLKINGVSISVKSDDVSKVIKSIVSL